MANILCVEDDIDISRGIAEFLEHQHVLDFAYNGKQALTFIATNSYDLILLDLNLPFVDGLDVCRTLLTTQLTSIPVVIMSARNTEKDILAGFDSGAWDYLAKPFSLAELSARITVCLAKVSNNSSSKNEINLNDVTLNCDDMTMSFNNTSTQLHRVGFELLKLLLQKAPNTVKTEHIHRFLWNEDTPDSDPLRAHVYKLRKQLKTTFGQEFITTIRGVGYKFQLDDQEK
ncbi:response regulator transcription factor [Pseudoalteromonas sp. MMG013]|uniref:response regulator transcription factor n=1 Tax=Pseudoalteromonas sp. MMG013 TaxID=2822687 RepID=UPI001B36CFC0|nr:response regulator transcription factor [Pseudoalteromonas sp. MMG013]MBQ4863234.1 response regulator transcription factor [Pseudoalteromonas sp. MMG013]